MAVHKLIIDDNKLAELTGVQGILSFDKKTVVYQLNEQKLTLSGDDMSVESFDKESGVSKLKGNIRSAVYAKSNMKAGGIFKKLFK